MENKKNLVTLLRFIYPLWAIIGMFSIMYVPSKLINWKDSLITANNISANELLFRLGIFGSLITQLLFIFAVLILFKLFKKVNKNQSLLMIVFALVSVPIAMLNTLNRLAALRLLGNPEQMMFFLNLNIDGMMIATIFWGLWLFPLAFLVYKSGYFPKFLGVILGLAGLGYVLDSITYFLIPNITFFGPIVEVLTIGEVIFMLWVIFRGAKLSKIKNE
jgi:hypothetical protein